MAPTKQLSQQEMKKEFLEIDEDGDGTITVEELGNALRSLKVKLKYTDKDIQQTLKAMDKDGDGTINLKEYFAHMKNTSNRNLIHKALVERSKLRKQFLKFDKDGSGYVTVDEAKQVFDERTGGSIDIAQVKEMLKDSDKNDDGKINYEEFVVMMTK